MSSGYPARIVCLSAETVDVLYRLDCADRIVGVTGFAVEPAAARLKARVGGFSSVDFDKIDELKPDLIITFSDVQAEAARELLRRGHVVLGTNQRSLDDIFNTILLTGRMVERTAEAKDLVEQMRKEIFEDTPRPTTTSRPRVYFEEWNEPLVCGIWWVSELIEAAGGEDTFRERSRNPHARNRTVSEAEVIAREPEIIVASWCGKPVDVETISRRPGWGSVPAVRDARIYEIKSEQILQPGPGLLQGFRGLKGMIASYS